MDYLSHLTAAYLEHAYESTSKSSLIGGFPHTSFHDVVHTTTLTDRAGLVKQAELESRAIMEKVIDILNR